MSQFYDQASLVMVPSGYKAGKVYSQKPLTTDGQLTFTRTGDTATRVNSDGLVEKVRTNLLLQSNSFDTTWVSLNTTETGGQAGYDGTNDAWLITKSAAAARVYQTISHSGVHTFSAYVKAGTLNWVALSNNLVYTYFNLSAGTIGTNVGTISANIQSVGNNWYRCSITYSGSATDARIYPSQGDNNSSGTSGNIYIQDAQLETGDIATAYIPTTTAAVSVGPVANLPRIDYTGSACGKLLLEPQRNNLALYSEQFNNSTGWALFNGATITANTTISPDGYQNADTLNFGASSTSQVYGNIAASTNTYSFSVYAKSSTGKKFRFKIATSSGDTFSSEFTTTSEWQRFTFSHTEYIYHMAICNESAGGVGSIQIWGAQFEAGSYATSYIPTLSAAVTRGADAAYKTGISSLIGQTEGTLFVDFIMPPAGTLFTHYRISGTGGLYNDSQNITVTATNEIRGWSFAASNEQAQINSGTYAEGTRVKVAYAYKANDFVLYVNGVQIGTDTSGSVPAMSEFLLGSYYPNTSLNVVNKTSQTLLFTSRLTNAQLAELTTL